MLKNIGKRHATSKSQRAPDDTEERKRPEVRPRTHGATAVTGNGQVFGRVQGRFLYDEKFLSRKKKASLSQGRSCFGQTGSRTALWGIQRGEGEDCKGTLT